MLDEYDTFIPRTDDLYDLYDLYDLSYRGSIPATVHDLDLSGQVYSGSGMI